MGTPEFAVPALEALVAAGHDVCAVYTQPPRPARRGKQLAKSPIHIVSERLGIDVRTPENFKSAEVQADFSALRADVAVVAAYGLILPAAILEAPARGCINIHASLLPRWRGAAPIQRAILAGDDETGVTIMQMERGLDTGPMLLAKRTRVDHKTAGALTTELAAMGGNLVTQVLAAIERITAVPQPNAGVTYANKIDKAEAALDFSQPAELVERAVRAFNPAPGAFAILGGERIRILAADIVDAGGTPGRILDEHLTIACSSGAIRPTEVQRPGKRIMDTQEMLRGLPIKPGTPVG